MVAVSKTLGPIHFEDLEPKRFESLVRGLLYDFRDWNKMQSTGIPGSDEGFDIRAWEKKYVPTPSTDEDTQDGSVIPVDGNLWMIQCKRESGIGPKKVGDILDECIPDKTDVPHGFILVASTNFSKESFDKFAKKLQERGVVEFHLWGKPELESMLMQPKFDRVLFSFFGISLVAKRRSTTSKIKAMISVKNKLRSMLGDTDPRLGDHRSILIKDINADMYPWKKEYPDFEKLPRWIEVSPYEYYPIGLIVRRKEHFGYIDEKTKTWDFIEIVDNLHKESEERYFHKPDKNAELAREFWNHLPRKNKTTIYRQGLVRFKDILAIDDKGDTTFDFPHIYVDRNTNDGLFKVEWEQAEVGGEYGHEEKIDLQFAGYKQKSYFPKVLPTPKKGKFHKDKIADIDQDLLRIFTNNNQYKDLIASDHKYDYLSQDDIVEYPTLTSERTSTKEYIKILHKYSTTVKKYLIENPEAISKTVLEKQVGENQLGSTKIDIFEFEITYYRPETK